MTYILAYTICGLTFASLLGKLLKRNLERNYPNCDDDGEVEAFLADGLAVCLAKEVA
ncbi:hypothetical protein RJJ65_32250 [Rhizobium hidalgonense]|uniref:Uncharacterized protein n=1 Tax=Rhizobium hidalgonense TaxID=1538159 RepID=A0AAJ2GYA8_9HYPH|nr:hypothetical protein [Rhizobium hidalgonense]MDR9777231.1 hypothetical protein [Rhizobium hidalgonense]